MFISHLGPLFAKCLLKYLDMSIFKKLLGWFLCAAKVENHQTIPEVSAALFLDVLPLNSEYFGSEGSS